MNSDTERDPNSRPPAARDFNCRFILLSLDQPLPHPSYKLHGVQVLPSQLAGLMALGDWAFQQPITVTHTGIVIDGYARWELARRQGRQSICCLEYELSDEEALRWLILSHCPTRGLNGYRRSLLALDLESCLQEKARRPRCRCYFWYFPEIRF